MQSTVAENGFNICQTFIGEKVAAGFIGDEPYH